MQFIPGEMARADENQNFNSSPRRARVVEGGSMIAVLLSLFALLVSALAAWGIRHNWRLRTEEKRFRSEVIARITEPLRPFLDHPPEGILLWLDWKPQGSPADSDSPSCTVRLGRKTGTQPIAAIIAVDFPAREMTVNVLLPRNARVGEPVGFSSHAFGLELALVANVVREEIAQLAPQDIVFWGDGVN